MYLLIFKVKLFVFELFLQQERKIYAEYKGEPQHSKECGGIFSHVKKTPRGNPGRCNNVKRIYKGR